MKITKFGHCCLLIEVKELRILTDPGNYNETPEAENVDVVLITHEHQDHRLGPTRRVPTAVLEPLGIRYVDMTEGSVQDFSGFLE